MSTGFAQIIVGVALLTACDTAPLVLPANPLLAVVPLYTAVMLCGLPTTFRIDMVHAAVLPTSATVEHVVIGAAPSLKATLPSLLGLPAADVTVAVKVTASPYVLGLAPAVRARL